MKKTYTLTEVNQLGLALGRASRGSECIELIGDVGTGKTTLTKAIARGLAVDEDVQSPTFTISRTYPARDGLELHHYDFYRLHDPGIMRYELAESLDQPTVIAIIEWGDAVTNVLPAERITIRLSHETDSTRTLDIRVPKKFDYLQEAVS